MAQDAVRGDVPVWTRELENAQPTFEKLIRYEAKGREYIQRHPYFLIPYILLAETYTLLGYPDLTAGAAYKALLLTDAVQDDSDEYHEVATNSVAEFVTSIPSEDQYKVVGLKISNSGTDDSQADTNSLVLDQYLPKIYRLLIHSLSLCGCYKTAASYYLQGSARYPGDSRMQQAYEKVRGAVANHFNVATEDLETSETYSTASWPDNGHIRREVYPWNNHEPNRLQEVAALNEMMAKVAPKLEVKVVDLPILASNRGANTNAAMQQLGVFAKEDVKAEEIILDETSILTANNKLQDTLCDACSADLPDLDSEDGNATVSCPDCEVVFCSQKCSDGAMEAYHPALCDMDVEAIAKDVPSTESAESLYSLLLLRALAMAQTQDCHPLDLKEVKYIWGDFHNQSIADYNYPMEDAFLRSDDVPQTLPFSFEYNIRLPFHMLEKMDIDIFANPQYDVWVFNTLYAKFRGTASARLSGSTGDTIKGPEVGAVHPMWCLANHSCDPNVSWEWGASIKFWVRDLRVTWERDNGEMHWNASGIKKGEEVLNHYCDIDLLVHERREWMRGTLGGDCHCRRCVWEAEDPE